MDIDELMRSAIADPRHEPAFLKALLDATLYVHLPLSDDSGRLRLIQFTRPDGLQVIPIFTDLDKANIAAQGAAKIGCVPGRELFEATRGATLMLNPNDHSCTVYPEEIAALLDRGDVAIVQSFVSDREFTLVDAGSDFRWIVDRAVEAIEPIEAVSAVYLARRVDVDAKGLLLVLVVQVPASLGERVARAIGTALVRPLSSTQIGVDVGVVEPGEQEPLWLKESGLEPAWRRSPGRPLS